MRVGSLELILSLISSTGSMVACVSTLYLYYPLHMMYLTAPKEKSNECSINVVLVLLLLVNMFAAGNVIASASVALLYQEDIPNWLCMVGGTVDQFTGFVCSCLMILFVINVKLVLGNSTTHLQSLNMIMFSLMMLLATVVASLTITQDWVKGGQQAWCSITDAYPRIPIWVMEAIAVVGAIYVFTPLLWNPLMNRYERASVRQRFTYTVLFACFSVFSALSFVYKDDKVVQAFVAFIDPLQGFANSIIFVISEGLSNFTKWDYQGKPYGFAYGITQLSLRQERAITTSNRSLQSTGGVTRHTPPTSTVESSSRASPQGTPPGTAKVMVAGENNITSDESLVSQLKPLLP